MARLFGGDRPAAVPFWRNRRLVPLLLQAAFLALLAAGLLWLAGNAREGLTRQGIASGFRFLRQSASFAIGESLIAYSPADSYGRAFLVGVLNTLRVSAIGIVLASLLGLVAGVARLSRNWLTNRLAAAYVEVIRNTPLLVQIFLWYFAVLIQLPRVEERLRLPGPIYLSNRVLAFPWFEPMPGARVWVGLGLLGLAAGWLVWRSRVRFQLRTGRPGRPELWAGGAVALGLTLAAILAPEVPYRLSRPELVGLVFEGGLQLSPEMSALLLGLVIYTGAFIAEIVRAGLLAVSKGQWEAARALGLPYGLTLRLIVFPQALRVIIPPLTSQYLNLVKNSSLAVAVAYPDLFSVAGTIFNQTGRAVEVVAMAMGSYLAISLFTSLLMNWFNRATQLVER